MHLLVINNCLMPLRRFSDKRESGIDKPDLMAAKTIKSLQPFQFTVLPGDRSFKGVSVKPVPFILVTTGK